MSQKDNQPGGGNSKPEAEKNTPQPQQMSPPKLPTRPGVVVSVEDINGGSVGVHDDNA